MGAGSFKDCKFGPAPSAIHHLALLDLFSEHESDALDAFAERAELRQCQATALRLKQLLTQAVTNGAKVLTLRAVHSRSRQAVHVRHWVAATLREDAVTDMDWTELRWVQLQGPRLVFLETPSAISCAALRCGRWSPVAPYFDFQNFWPTTQPRCCTVMVDTAQTSIVPLSGKFMDNVAGPRPLRAAPRLIDLGHVILGSTDLPWKPGCPQKAERDIDRPVSRWCEPGGRLDPERSQQSRIQDAWRPLERPPIGSRRSHAC